MHRIIDLRNSLPTGSAVARGRVGTSENAQPSLNPHAIAFITCVSDEKQYEICLRYIDKLEYPSGFTVEKIAVIGAMSMAEGYQRAMEASAAHYKIYVHQDVYVIHRGMPLELINLFRTYPRLGIVGLLGATQLPASGIFFANNTPNCYGRLWAYFRPPGLPASLFIKRRRLHLSRSRSFVGDYLRAAVLDGCFMATQYDIPWRDALGGFELYDQVQALEFIKAGLEVGIARQEATWCIHLGPLQERSPEQRRLRDSVLHRRAAVFRQLYQAFVGVPAQRLYEQHRGMARWLSAARESANEITSPQSDPRP